MQVCVVNKDELSRLVDALLEACGPDDDTAAAQALLVTATGPRVVINRYLLWKLGESAAAVLGALHSVEGFDADNRLFVRHGVMTESD